MVHITRAVVAGVAVDLMITRVVTFRSRPQILISRAPTPNLTRLVLHLARHLPVRRKVLNRIRRRARKMRRKRMTPRNRSLTRCHRVAMRLQPRVVDEGDGVVEEVVTGEKKNEIGTLLPLASLVVLV